MSDVLWVSRCPVSLFTTRKASFLEGLHLPQLNRGAGGTLGSRAHHGSESRCCIQLCLPLEENQLVAVKFEWQNAEKTDPPQHSDGELVWMIWTGLIGQLGAHQSTM